MPNHKFKIADLYRRHFGELVRFLSKRLACRELAADMAQELFARLLAKDGSVAALQDHRAYLFASARHLAAETRRSPKWRESADDAMQLGYSCEEREADSPELELCGKQSVEVLLQAVAKLPPRCREAFILHKFDGLSYSEVAERMDISAGAVEKHMVRALAECRARLDETGRGRSRLS